MSRKQLVNGVSIKVENRSGFDKGYFNALTTQVGTITPIVKQLMLPNSSGSCRIKISAQLPPLATDAFLRSHLKLEAFFVPLRLCYGGFESWFCGREVYDANNARFIRAKLPYLLVPDYSDFQGAFSDGTTVAFDKAFGSGSLLDYFGVYWKNDKRFSTRRPVSLSVMPAPEEQPSGEPYYGVNIFPHICYGLVYDEYYRNKFVERPLFAPPTARPSQDMALESTKLSAYNLPFISSGDAVGVVGASDAVSFGVNASSVIKDDLLNGRLCDLRQRNYGDDYFTAAMPNAGGEGTTISIVDGKFSIGALRLGNALAEFEDVNNYASPDYLQTLSARYGASLSAGIAQKPILLGSADFPMYTSGVEQTAPQWVNGHVQTTNPMQGIAARFGRAHAEGSDFVCKFNVDEPGYFMVMVTLVPEAQYFQGISRDMQIFLSENGGDSLTDLPCGLLESIGNDAIFENELLSSENGVFGYVQRYLWHKLGNRNQVHGLFRMDENLGCFVVQRGFQSVDGINSAFLKVKPSDLDNVATIQGAISKFGCMIDSKIDLFVSEPLTESAIPALANPAHEHGRTVYVKTGGSKLA